MRIGPDAPPTKRPPAIDEAWNYIFGDLKCTYCGGTIATSTVEYPDRVTQYVRDAIAMHVCPIPFGYDYNSPLSIQAQLQAHRQAHAQGETKPSDKQTASPAIK